jgi:hypothetical protein
VADRGAADERPGPVPDIRIKGDSVVFYLDLPREHGRLVVRCDPDGALRASLELTARTEEWPFDRDC